MTVSRSKPTKSPKVPPLPLPPIPHPLTPPPLAADLLISTLKSELAAQKEEAKDAALLKKQLETAELKLSETQTRVTSLTTSLSESRTEIKALTMKLTAARSAEASALAKASSSIPGSAMKGGLHKSNPTTQAAQMKEDLYSDLTGLIVRSVKRDAREDVYDCLQTGRNGSTFIPLFPPPFPPPPGY